MSLVSILILAVGLSMDAFAVAVCKGLGLQKMRAGDALLVGLFFGCFQALMPLVGWALGRQFERFITSLDHWISFCLLAFIGGKMIYASLRQGAAQTCREGIYLKELLALAIATSIDAMAVGVTFAFLSVNVTRAASFIGCTTFVLSALGVSIGYRFGNRYQKTATCCGGAVLLLIGLKILLEGLGVLH